MIKSFKHKGLKIFFERGVVKGIKSKHKTKLKIIFQVIIIATQQTGDLVWLEVLQPTLAYLNINHVMGAGLNMTIHILPAPYMNKLDKI